MTKTTTITINGRLYDAITGMPVAHNVQQQPQPVANKPITKPNTSNVKAFSDIAPVASQQPNNQAAATANKPTPKLTAPRPHATARTLHQTPKKSETLYRKALKKPEAQPQKSNQSETTRSPLISKFGKHITAHPHLNNSTRPNHESKTHEALPQPHPTVVKALQRNSKPAPAPQLSGSALKEQLIRERLAEVSPKNKPAQKQKWFKNKPKLASILMSTLGLLVLGGYLTYMNLPVISMQVAASRAGVHATYPNYRPDGYSLNGPITYAPGEVNINYKSTTNENGFRVTQKQSNWDSQALLDNYVLAHTENYLTFQERGVTVYTFDNKAAWVNGGLLYTLEGTASLSSDQVLRLATSM